MKVIKKLVSLLLAVIMLMSVICVAPIITQASTAHTQTEAVAWVKSKIGSKVGSGQCVALVYEYYKYLGHTSPGGDGSAYVSNKLPSGWERIPYSSSLDVQLGDIVVWSYTSAGGSAGHVAIIIEDNSNVLNAKIATQNPGPVASQKVSWVGGTIYGVIRPDFTTGTQTPTDKPGKPYPTLNKSLYPHGETITLSWTETSNATNYWLDFYKDGVKIDGRSVSSPLILTNLEPGEYSAYITATNSFGSTTSNACNFEVFNSSPGKPYPTSNKSLYPYGETVTLSWAATSYATNYWLDFYKDGVKIDGRSVSTPLILTNLEPGEYSAYITATNSFGTTTSNVCNFEVFNSSPGKPHLTSNNSLYQYGETVTLSWAATSYATNYWLDFYKDGVKIDGRSVSSPLILTNLEPGEYSAYITATNSFGTTTSNVCNFEVVNSNFINPSDSMPVVTEPTYTTPSSETQPTVTEPIEPSVPTNPTTPDVTDPSEHTHNHTSEITKQPTCTEEGVKTFTCDCGDTYTEVIPALGHKHTSKVTKKATCKAEGVMTYTCACGNTYTKKIAKVAHVTTKTTKKATYFANGYKNRKTCKVCKKVISKGTTLKKLKLKTPKVKYTGGKKKLTVKYTKVSGATGFQVKYKIGKKTVTKTYNTKKSVSKTIKKLKKGTYKVYVRAFVKSGSKKAYSSWTKAKSVKVKG